MGIEMTMKGSEPEENKNNSRFVLSQTHTRGYLI